MPQANGNIKTHLLNNFTLHFYMTVHKACTKVLHWNCRAMKLQQ